jgi:hypothetical protein
LFGAQTNQVRIDGSAKDTAYKRIQEMKMNRQNKGTCYHKLLIWVLQSGVPPPPLLLSIILIIK